MIKVNVQCPACDGTRVTLVPSADGDRNEPEPCMYCDGIGAVEERGEASEREEEPASNDRDKPTGGW